MKKILFLNILNISLLFFIIFLFLTNSINAQTYFNPSIGYGYSGYGRSFMPSGLGISGLRPYSYSGYSGYPGYGYPGGGYGGYNPFSSMPRWIIDMMAHSAYSPYEPDIAQMGYQLSLPYFYADVMRGWTPWISPYSNPQTYYKYGGYPPISPSWPPIGMAYDPYNGSFYIPGQYRVGYPGSYYR